MAFFCILLESFHSSTQTFFIFPSPPICRGLDFRFVFSLSHCVTGKQKKTKADFCHEVKKGFRYAEGIPLHLTLFPSPLVFFNHQSSTTCPFRDSHFVLLFPACVFLHIGSTGFHPSKLSSSSKVWLSEIWNGLQRIKTQTFCCSLGFFDSIH